LVAIGVGIVAVAALGYALTLRAELRRAKSDLGIAQTTAVSNRFGHPIGTEAPSFSLSDLHGETVTLDALLERNRPLLLVFVSPSCGPCAMLLPRVHQWQETLSERLTIAVITTGTAEQNAGLAEAGLDDVLLQQEIEVQKIYGVSGTPTAVLVSAEGKIASGLGESEFGIEPLLRMALRHGANAQLEASTA
jgi:methylamine dehydrogenase accessory protein MauD